MTPPTVQASRPNAIDVAVGLRIRLARKLLGVSQGALAEHLGITFQQVQKYERGTNRVSASMLVAIAQRLQTTVAVLVGEADATPADARVLDLVAAPLALELLEAWEHVPDLAQRRALVRLVSAMAKVPSSANPQSR